MPLEKIENGYIENALIQPAQAFVDLFSNWTETGAINFNHSLATEPICCFLATDLLTSVLELTFASTVLP